ncbi:GTP-binding protein HflX [Isosphaera pallida ATCC 43644]|uniref:GTPase HflX n=1 Tax=Isosphaera pallida (strain ATCC 43644 / DSM 9630 / IS1B) TaxID=575540 RepID=E8R4P2_ISOPI|nr:GTPase HflX [Isosphaera pallida]ADV60633.1 GTP-binding protein HflX [Isosphaera pallida ATCC 43644]
MAELKSTQPRNRRERAILVGVLLPDGQYNPDDPLDEIRGLAETAGLVVLAGLLQNRREVDPATYIGSGKVAELKELVEAHEADLVLFDNDLGPAQTRNLEQQLKVKVIDRTEVILDIFATRARTYEARLQVELAQLEYAMPRLKRMWTHLSRYKGGVGVRGPGEKQLEEDRRLVAKRIQDLKAKLAVVQARKEREVAARTEVPTVSLVGYTNAGKSTLMNALTGAGVYTADQLFATLDTRTRQWHFKGGGHVLLSDTVGFIRNLPHSLVASFKATLEEARQADVLLHVVDASSHEAERQIEAVEAVLHELALSDVPTLLVLNKCDRVRDQDSLAILRARHPEVVEISAATGTGLAELEAAVRAKLNETALDVEIHTHAGDGKVLAYLAQHAHIHSQDYSNTDDLHVRLLCRLPRKCLGFLSEQGVNLHITTLVDQTPMREDQKEMISKRRDLSNSNPLGLSLTWTATA